MGNEIRRGSRWLVKCRGQESVGLRVQQIPRGKDERVMKLNRKIVIWTTVSVLWLLAGPGFDLRGEDDGREPETKKARSRSETVNRSPEPGISLFKGKDRPVEADHSPPLAEPQEGQADRGLGRNQPPAQP